MGWTESCDYCFNFTAIDYEIYLNIRQAQNLD